MTLEEENGPVCLKNDREGVAREGKVDFVREKTLSSRICQRPSTEERGELTLQCFACFC